MGEEQIAEAEQRLVCLFKSFLGVERGAWKLGQLSEFAELLAAQLRASKSSQLQCLFACAGDLVEKLADLGESAADGVGEGTFEVAAQGLPVGVAAEDKGLHPVVAPGEHLREQIFQLLPIVVAPTEQQLDGCADRGAGPADLFHGGAGGAAAEVVGLPGDGQAAA